MYSRGKGQQQAPPPPQPNQPQGQPPQQQQQQQQPNQPIIPIEVQAKEKLIVYVYEFLIHFGAKNTAQSFLNEIRWDKSFNIGEAPGFLFSWWNVFWDLYCVSNPDRSNQFDPSNEAKAFHDYTANIMINQQQQGPQDPNNMQNNPNHQIMNPNNNFFNPSGGQGPNNQIMNPGQQYQRFHSAGPGPRPIRMPNSMEFNPAGSNMNPGGPNQMTPDPNRIQAGMSPISRLTPPGNRMPPGMAPQQPVGPNQMNFNGPQTPQMRVPPNQAPTPGLPNQPQQMSNAPMSPMSMSMQQQQQRWNTGPNPGGPSQQQVPPQQMPGQQQNLPPPPPPPHNMNYTSASSPISYSNVQMTAHHGPGTPGIISSPQDTNGDINFNNLMKTVPSGIPFNDHNMGVPINTDMGHHNQLNNEMIESIKHSPIQNMQVNRHQGEEHNGANPINEINYSHFGDPSGLF